jgi:hypothetical protein
MGNCPIIGKYMIFIIDFTKDGQITKGRILAFRNEKMLNSAIARWWAR